ncbi:sensor histidine kinase [Rhodococcus gordoniae]|uniref:sensor histidine kinase n=1 Tax=Rhodococcus gordoniae TaxID=223392 RepID=UPI0007CD6095|nr:ATP-binding protein [Rhodococcus gordoniae]
MRQFRRHTPENWRLWRRMTVVVAVPIVAATLYGSLRVYDLYQENDAYSAAAENVSILPTLADYATSVTGAAAATILSLPVDNGAQVARESAATLRDHIDGKDLDPQIAAMINRMLAEGESLLDSASSGTLAPTVASERAEGFVSRAQAAYRAITTTTDDLTVQRESATLLDLWDTQWSLLDQVLAYSALSTGTDGALLMWNNALGVESARLAVLRDTFVENDAADAARVDGLMSQLQNRRSITANLDNDEGNVAALRGSIFESLMVYQEEVSGSATRAVAVLDDLAAGARTEALKNAIGVAIILLLALTLAIVIAMSLVRPLRRLRDDTLRTAEQDLPAALAAIKDGAEIESVTLDPVRVRTREEIGEVARAVDNMKEGALRLAGEQAQLRRQVNEMLETLARRNKTLVEQQLALIDSLEHEERDPMRLQNLFALDHLAARMRRTGDSLLVLAGTRQRLGRVPDTRLVDVLRASVSQVENYQRVNIGNAPEGSLVGSAVTDVVHMIAELLDNALRASPPESNVAFAFSRAVDGGLLLEIADRGIGIPADELLEINMRLGSAGEAGSGAARRMGLFVVARLADRHNITVRLRPTFDSTSDAGITASIYLPTSLLKGTGRNYDDPYRIDRPRRLPDPTPERTEQYRTEQYHADPVSVSQPTAGNRQPAPAHVLATPGTSPGIRRGRLHERRVPGGAGQ